MIYSSEYIISMTVLKYDNVPKKSRDLITILIFFERSYIVPQSYKVSLPGLNWLRIYCVCQNLLCVPDWLVLTLSSSMFSGLHSNVHCLTRLYIAMFWSIFAICFSTLQLTPRTYDSTAAQKISQSVLLWFFDFYCKP